MAKIILELDGEHVDKVIIKTLHTLYFEMLSQMDSEVCVFEKDKKKDVKAIRSFMKSIADVHNYYTSEAYHL